MKKLQDHLDRLLIYTNKDWHTADTASSATLGILAPPNGRAVILQTKR